MTPQCVTLSKHVSFCPIAAGFLNCWLMSHGDEASGIGAKPTLTKPSGLTRTTFSCLLTRRIRIPHFVVSPMRCENLIRFSTSYRTTWIRSRIRRLCYKPRVICRVLLRYSHRCDRLPTTQVRWKHKFTRRSWSVALHKSFLG